VGGATVGVSGTAGGVLNDPKKPAAPARAPVPEPMAP
jgi:hypothetical protein